MQLSGKVIKLLPFETGMGAKGQWRKMSFVIETLGEHSKKVCFEAWGKACDHTDNLKIGQEVTVSFNLESREYNDKWYTSASAWNIGVKGQPKTETIQSEEDQDLPF